MFVNKDRRENVFSTGLLTFLQCFTFNNDKKEAIKSSLYTQIYSQSDKIHSVPLEPIIRLCLLSCVSFVFLAFFTIDQFRNFLITVP